jgi:hypothetical protein
MKLSTLFTAAAFGLLVGATAASAATPDAHPRVAEVHDRSVHQDHRITRLLRHGNITFAHAERLRLREGWIRHREFRMARHDHGHLTRFQAARLNHAENRVGRDL